MQDAGRRVSEAFALAWREEEEEQGDQTNGGAEAQGSAHGPNRASILAPVLCGEPAKGAGRGHGESHKADGNAGQAHESGEGELWQKWPDGHGASCIGDRGQGRDVVEGENRSAVED